MKNEEGYNFGQQAVLGICGLVLVMSQDLLLCAFAAVIAMAVVYNHDRSKQ